MLSLICAMCVQEYDLFRLQAFGDDPDGAPLSVLEHIRQLMDHEHSELTLLDMEILFVVHCIFWGAFCLSSSAILVCAISFLWSASFQCILCLWRSPAK